LTQEHFSFTFKGRKSTITRAKEGKTPQPELLLCYRAGRFESAQAAPSEPATS